MASSCRTFLVLRVSLDLAGQAAEDEGQRGEERGQRDTQGLVGGMHTDHHPWLLPYRGMTAFHCIWGHIRVSIWASSRQVMRALACGTSK